MELNDGKYSLNYKVKTLRGIFKCGYTLNLYCNSSFTFSSAWEFVKPKHQKLNEIVTQAFIHSLVQIKSNLLTGVCLKC